jgi:hypothetical protein
MHMSQQALHARQKDAVEENLAAPRDVVGAMACSDVQACAAHAVKLLLLE